MTPDQITPDSLLNVRWMELLCKTLYQALEKLNAPATVKRALTDSGDLGHVAWWISTLPSGPVEPAAMGSPRLFEVSVNIRRHAVICATSEEDALQHVEDWEDSWDNYSDRIEISEPEVLDSRDLKVSDPRDWKVEAHDITSDAKKLLANEGESEEVGGEG